MRRTGIKRGTKPLKRTELKRTDGFRRRIPAERAQLLVEQQAAYIRDGGCVLRTGHRLACEGPITWHHVLPWRKGGSDHRDNLRTLCLRHHSWVEGHPYLAAELGLLDVSKGLARGTGGV